MKNRTTLFITLLASLLITFFLLAPLSHAQASGGERILSFDSRVVVHADGGMVVEETIRVRSEGHEIKRGIYRDFPTAYQGRQGLKHVTQFQVKEVLRDGRPESFHMKSMENGERLYIGRKDFYLRTGEYTYRITYITDRQIGFFDDHDELYWNVTGNGWIFPLDRATATVELPSGAGQQIIAMDGYTGYEGEHQKLFTVEKGADGTARFETTAMLKSNQGLTIVLSWPKGFVQPPTQAMEARYFLRDAAHVIPGVAGLLILLLYYLHTWSRVGRDPEKGVIFPRYFPPDGLTPASVRYIMEMGYDHKVLTSAVINLAVKGYVKIEQKDDTYVLHKLKEPDAGLSRGESRLLTDLLGSSKQLELKQKHHSTISTAITQLKSFLKTEYKKQYFLTNSTRIIPGIIISLIAIGASIAILRANPGVIALIIHSLVWPPVFVLFSRFYIPKWKTFLQTRKASHLCVVLIMSPHYLMLTGAVIVILFLLFKTAQATFTVVYVLMILVNVLFYYLMKAPTPLGRKAMDRIEGFRMYLRTAEKDRLNLLNPPERTPELFERFLPYALALNVENQWAEQFADVFARAGSAAGTTVYRSTWYSGRDLDFSRGGGFASAFAGSLSSAISSSSTAPGSSSGFSGGGGGGGSSGGGGGGGGGGGW